MRKFGHQLNTIFTDTIVILAYNSDLKVYLHLIDRNSALDHDCER